MEQLRPVELKIINELFGMNSGYVLDFTNSTFADFFRREVGIDIYTAKRTGSGVRRRIQCSTRVAG